MADFIIIYLNQTTWSTQCIYKLDAGMWRYHVNRMDARRSQFDLGRVVAYGEKSMTIVSRFHLIPERYARTDGRTDRFAISISRVSMLTRDKNSRVRRIHVSKPTVHIIGLIISLCWNQVDKPQLATMTHTKQAATQDSTTLYNRTQSFGTRPSSQPNRTQV